MMKWSWSSGRKGCSSSVEWSSRLWDDSRWFDGVKRHQIVSCESSSMYVARKSFCACQDRLPKVNLRCASVEMPHASTVSPPRPTEQAPRSLREMKITSMVATIHRTHTPLRGRHQHRQGYGQESYQTLHQQSAESNVSLLHKFLPQN